jgi:hypothetical protein
VITGVDEVGPHQERGGYDAADHEQHEHEEDPAETGHAHRRT